MKNFDIKRFGQLMKWTLISQKSQLFKFSMIWMIALLFLLLFNIYLRQFGLKMDYASGLRYAMTAAVNAFLVLVVFSPCFILMGMKTKQSKVNLLMLPATNMEKFVSRYVMVTLVWMLSFAVQFVVADLLQWLLALIAHPAENGLVMTQLFTHKINLIMVTKHHYILFGILLLWWLHSFYLVGGMFFCRHAGIIVTLSLIVLGIAFGSWVVSVFDETTPMWIKSSLHLFEVLLAALVMFNYWASYRIFKRLQVINNKWINL